MALESDETPITLNNNPPKYLEETLNEECKNLVLTLPKAKGWLSSHLYRYHGFWFPPRHLQGVVSCQKNFKAQESDIFLVTAPKSGTTWLKALIFAMANRTKFPITSIDHPLITNNPHDLIPFLEIKLYVNDENPNLSSVANSPRIFATHMPYDSLPETVKKCPTCKIVYLCRDPKDVFVSLWHFANRLKPQELEKTLIEEAFHMFCEGVSLFGPLWDHILGYWERSSNTEVTNDGPEVLFLKYEDVKAKPGDCLRRIANFLNCPFTDDEESNGLVEEIIKMCAFDNLSNFETNKNGKLSSGEENNAFFRRGVVGDWKNYLSSEMVVRFDQITEEKFKGSGLIF